MIKRTTVLLEGEVYDALVRESLEKYRNSKAISKVLNEMIKRTLTSRGKLSKLLHSKKFAYVSQKDFEGFRKGLSRSVVER